MSCCIPLCVVSADVRKSKPPPALYLAETASCRAIVLFPFSHLLINTLFKLYKSLTFPEVWHITCSDILVKTDGELPSSAK